MPLFFHLLGTLYFPPDNITSRDLKGEVRPRQARSERALKEALSEGVTLRVAYLLLHYVASSQRQ